MRTKLFTLVTLLSTMLTAFTQPKKVAVYVMGDNVGINKVLEGKLVNALSKSGKYTAIERTSTFLSKLSKEQRTGIISDNEIAALGAQFGVNYVCITEVVDVFDEKYISARLIDVETAEIVNTYNTDGKINTMDQCIKMANDVANNLTKRSFTEQVDKERIKAAAESKKTTRIKEAQWKAERDNRIEEAQKVAELVIAKQHDGYVDMGLPSGTLWSARSENKEYKYNEAIQKFGILLPTSEHWDELKKNCKWTWNGYGYDITGPNGQSIVLPATKIGTHVYGGVYGSYWIYDSRYITSDEGTAPIFSVQYDDVSTNGWCDTEYPSTVRLIKSPNLPGAFVDLGLPSGTLWRDKNETDGDNHFFTYDKAVSQFGSKLPTKEQFQELKDKCQWTWTIGGYKITGPNGNSITLSAAGCHSRKSGVDKQVGVVGGYWSSTPDENLSEGAWYLEFGSSWVKMETLGNSAWISVRLVQSK